MFRKLMLTYRSFTVHPNIVYSEPMVIGDPGNTTTLNHLIQMYGIIPNSTIAEVMNIQGGVLCYDYD